MVIGLYGGARILSPLCSPGEEEDEVIFHESE